LNATAIIHGVEKYKQYFFRRNTSDESQTFSQLEFSENVAFTMDDSVQAKKERIREYTLRGCFVVACYRKWREQNLTSSGTIYAKQIFCLPSSIVVFAPEELAVVESSENPFAVYSPASFAQVVCAYESAVSVNTPR
jgi:hypothetical protein